jgi:hypothetical protein
MATRTRARPRFVHLYPIHHKNFRQQYWRKPNLVEMKLCARRWNSEKHVWQNVLRLPTIMTLPPAEVVLLLGGVGYPSQQAANAGVVPNVGLLLYSVWSDMWS